MRNQVAGIPNASAVMSPCSDVVTTTRHEAICLATEVGLSCTSITRTFPG